MRAAVAIGLLGAVACSVSPASTAGKACSDIRDCDLGDTCVIAANGSRTCQPATSVATLQRCPDAGPVTYSIDVAPILDTYCATCHTVPPAAHDPPVHTGFRLDMYSDQPDGGVGPDGGPAIERGAYFMRNDINTRAFRDSDMPPFDAPAFPLDEQRCILAAWVSLSAPEYPDAGTDGGP